MRTRHLLVLGLVAGLTVAGCGSSSKSNDSSSSTTSGGSDTAQVKAVVTSLFTALTHEDFATACDDYTAKVQALVVTAGQTASQGKAKTCTDALTAISKLAPGAFAQLGKPTSMTVKINGDTATVAATVAAPGGKTAHTTFAVLHQGDQWKVDKAASLTFSSSASG